MPVFQLTEELIFPHPSLAKDGLLAVGGDLSPERLLLAYENGIFPWYNEGEPILWHAPDPRFVLYPKNIKISKSMKQVLNKQNYKLKVDNAFEEVIRLCKEVKRAEEDGTWITNDIERAYIQLHKRGFAHSIEVYNKNGKLVGGVYGIKLGSVFFGESMFSKRSNTSKMALISLAHFFIEKNYRFIDCQIHNDHLESMGATLVSREDFLDELEIAITESMIQVDWSKEFDIFIHSESFTRTYE